MQKKDDYESKRLYDGGNDNDMRLRVGVTGCAAGIKAREGVFLLISY